ncbi:1295_t:CDS:2 [Ambispora gerdemannii]|uniref:1295_t:CDS:1 n=1 Tax=Ambispora gerdemannii TaxID=144530 RepID=A0A9N9CBE5_9GLOM|nr:1295_t:CDS:2 [Ambispora gerdemannii]
MHVTVFPKHRGRSRGEYTFLCKVKTAEPLPEKPEYGSCLVMTHIALDPGVHTFMTSYDPNELVVEWGEVNAQLAIKHKRYKLRRAMLRIQKKIRSLVDDCYHKLSK